MPSVDTIKTMWDANPDGAGFMVAHGKGVVIHKGFMKIDNFLTAIAGEGDLTDRSVVMHFRIATHGGTNPQCTHPFPLTDDMKKLRATKAVCKMGVAHNGIIPNMATGDKVSDTMAYIADILYPLSRLTDITKNEYAEGIIDATLHSKLCLLDETGEITTYGDFVEDGGMYYSNASYKERWSNWSYSPRYGGYYSKAKFLTEAEKAELPWSPCRTCDIAVDCYYEEPFCSTLAEAKLNSYTGEEYELPYKSCADCIEAGDCAVYSPYCTSEEEAAEVVDELNLAYSPEYGKQLSIEGEV